MNIPKEYEAVIWGYLVLTAMAVAGETLHLFIPITPEVSIVFCIMGLLILAGWLLGIAKRTELVFYCAVSATLALLIPLLWHQYYDTGLYHLQAMNWIATYPVQFGLANVHCRLGYNSIWFILGTLFDYHVLASNTPYFILNAIVVFIYTAPVIRVIGKQDLETSDIFYLLTFAPLLAFGGIFLTSASADLCVMLVCFSVFVLLIKEYEEPNRDIMFAAVLLSAFAGMVKASMLLLCAMVLAIYIYRYAWKHVWAIPVVFIPWIATGIITSGYLLYPFSFTRLPFEWSVPVAIAVQDASDISRYAWAYGYYIPVLAEAAVLAVVSLVFFRGRPTNLAIPLMLSATGVVAWLATAPEPRYGLGYIFALPLILLASGLATSPAKWKCICGLVTIGLMQGIAIWLVYLHTNVPFAFPAPVGDQIWNGGLK